MDQLRFEKSHPIPAEGFQVFNYPDTYYGIADELEDTITTDTNLTEDGNPILFSIPISSAKYINLQNLKLHIKAKIVKEDGSKLPASLVDPEKKITRDNWNKQHDVGPVNLWLHSLFSYAELRIQDQPVERCFLYPYKSYLETIVFPYNAARGEGELFFKDHYADMDSTAVCGNNDGFTRRATKAVESMEFDMIGRLHFDMCRIPKRRYIPDNMKINIRLEPAKDMFRLMSNAGKCRVKLTTAELKVPYIVPTPQMRENMEKILADDNFIYPIYNTEVKYFSIPAGRSDIAVKDPFQGKIPLKMVFGCVDEQGFFGAYDKNPYNFVHNFVSEVVVKLPNKNEGHTLNFEGGNTISVTAFDNMFNDDADKQITSTDFNQGYTLFNFNLREVPQTDNETESSGNGNFVIHMKFSKPIAKNMKIVMMAKFPRIVQIDKDRQILV